MTILIAGAGPAGAHLASLLAHNGIKVILVDKLKHPYEQTFSSAAIPISAISTNNIPKDSISSFWNSWNIFGPDGNNYKWVSNEHIGVVLDFGKLRQCLWQRASSLGVDILLGWKVLNVTSSEKYADVVLVSSDGIKKIMKVNLVVDATGSKRSFLGLSMHNSDEVLEGSGIEWVLEGNEMISRDWGESLSFFLGSNWVKYGYGWIFPMEGNQIKIGICRLPPTRLRSRYSNLEDLKSLIYRNGLNNLKVIDKHGGSIKSTLKRTELHYKNRIIGVGDSISTANLLGGEGIRHAMTSSEVLSEILKKVVKKNSFCSLKELRKLDSYSKKLKNKFGWKWLISNKIAKRTWLNLENKSSDKKLNKILYGLSKNGKAKDLSDILFEYKFGSYGIRLFPYLIGFK